MKLCAFVCTLSYVIVILILIVPLPIVVFDFKINWKSDRYFTTTTMIQKTTVFEAAIIELIDFLHYNIFGTFGGNAFQLKYRNFYSFITIALIIFEAILV